VTVTTGLVAGSFLMCAAAAASQSNRVPDLAEVKPLFAAVTGDWSCTGAFADGRPLAADLSFVADLNGRIVRYIHRDQPPNGFVEEAMWGPDAAHAQLVSIAFLGNTAGLSPALFVAKTWSARSVVFESATLTSPPFAPNRFTYTVDDPKGLTMIWEVQRNGSWVIGDRLDCTRR
jgi:hypothetical protein